MRYTLVLLALLSCANVLGQYEVRDDDGAGASMTLPACSSDADCPAAQGCASDNVCRDRCSLDSACASGSCSGNLCAALPGEACTSLTDCGDGLCREVDNHGLATPGYCSSYCSSGGPCPAGFECIAGACLKIVGAPLCFHPDVSQPCGNCVDQYCRSELASCCDEQECSEIYDAIVTCDQTLDYMVCNELYNSTGITYDATTEFLLDCTTQYCECVCYNRCPGPACTC